MGRRGCGRRVGSNAQGPAWDTQDDPNLLCAQTRCPTPILLLAFRRQQVSLRWSHLQPCWCGAGTEPDGWSSSHRESPCEAFPASLDQSKHSSSALHPLASSSRPLLCGRQWEKVRKGRFHVLTLVTAQETKALSEKSHS